MMKKIALCLCLTFLIFGWTLHAVTIQGQIIDGKTKNAIEGASVFFEGTSIGTSSSVNGSFRIVFKSSESYKLVVTHLGYAPYTIEISQIKTDEPLNISLKEKAIELKEFSIVSEEKNRPENLRLFTRALLGSSAIGQDCIIINPEVISFRREQDANKKLVLKAIADAPILIENKTFGYLIEYTSVDFTLSSTRVSFYGYPFFKELKPKNDRTAKKIIKARNNAYYGSTMHFFRSLFKDSLASEGFVVNQTKIVNDSDLFKEQLIDTTSFDSKGTPQKRAIEVNMYNVIRDLTFTRKEGHHLQQTNTYMDLKPYLNKSGSKASLTLFEPIEICYTKSGTESEYLLNHPFMGQFVENKKMQTTLVRLLNDVLDFDSNGLIFNPTEMTTIGYWGFKRMGDMLPSNYEPVPEL